MSANACIYVDQGDPPAFVRSGLRRARKPHRCCECGDPINVGDLHEYIAGCWDGEWADYRTCARCCNVAKDYFDGRCITAMVSDFKAEHGIDYREGIPAHITPCRGRP